MKYEELKKKLNGFAESFMELTKALFVAEPDNLTEEQKAEILTKLGIAEDLIADVWSKIR